MSQTTFWQNSFLSMDVRQQAIWFSVLHSLYMYSVGKFWSVTCLYLEYINRSQGITKWKLCKICLLMLSLCISLIYNFLVTGNKIQHAKYSDFSKSKEKSLRSQTVRQWLCLLHLPEVILFLWCTWKLHENQWVANAWGEILACSSGSRKGDQKHRASKLWVTSHRLLFTLCLRGKPCSHPWHHLCV